MRNVLPYNDLGVLPRKLVLMDSSAVPYFAVLFKHISAQNLFMEHSSNNMLRKIIMYTQPLYNNDIWEMTDNIAIDLL